MARAAQSVTAFLTGEDPERAGPNATNGQAPRRPRPDEFEAMIDDAAEALGVADDDDARHKLAGILADHGRR